MIEAQLLRERGILVIEPRGSLEQTDFERLALLVDPYIRAAGRLNGILIFSESFTGWEDFGAMLSQLRFMDDHQKDVRRVAVLGEGGVLSLLPRIGDWLTAAEVRSFDYADRDLAEAWLGGETVD